MGFKKDVGLQLQGNFQDYVQNNEHQIRPRYKRGLATSTYALILFSLLCLTENHLNAQVHPKLEEARGEFLNQNHEKVIKLVRPLVEPRSVLASEKEEAEAYKMLGVSYWWLKKPKASEASFLVLLGMKPDAKLNAAVHPAGVIKFFKNIKEKLKHKPQEIRKRQTRELEVCRKKLSSAKSRIQKLKDSAVVTTIIERPLWLSFIPFGVGQFNNGDRTKGWIFFSLETALVLANLTSYILAETPWVRNGPGSTVRDDEKSIRRARNVQISQITTGSLFIGVAAAGIIEALISYQSRTVRTRPVKIEEPETESTQKQKSRSQSKLWKRLQIRPSPLPGGGGIGVSFDF